MLVLENYKTTRRLFYNIFLHLHDLGLGDGFLYMTLEAQQRKKTDKLDIIKIKTCLALKHISKKMKRQPKEWDRSSAIIPVRNLYTEYTKNYENSIIKDVLPN